MLTFSMALELIKTESVLTRESWHNEEHVFYVSGEHLKDAFFANYGVGIGNEAATINDLFCYFNGTNITLGWVPTLDDILADDWKVVD